MIARSWPRAETSAIELLAVAGVTSLLALSLVILPREFAPVVLIALGLVAAGVFLVRPILVLLTLLAIYPFYMVISALFLSGIGGLAGAAVALLKELLLIGLLFIALLTAGSGALPRYARLWSILAAFCALLVLLTLLTQAPMGAAIRSARFHLTYPLLLPVAVAIVRTPGAARQVGWIVLAAAAAAAVGWLSVLGWVGLSGLSYAAATTQVLFEKQEFGDPINVLGTYMSVATCLAVGYAQHAPTSRWRLALYGLAAVFGWALLTTFSRRSILAAVIGVAVIAWIGRRWRLLLGGAVASAVVAAFGSVYLLRRLSLSYAADHEGTSIRLYHLRYTLENLDPLSFFVGHGMGTAGHVAVAAGTEGAVDLHNYYLLLLFESGMFGLGLYLALCWLTFRRLKEVYRNTSDQWPARGLMLGALGAFPAFLATGMFGIGNAVLPNAPLVWALLGCGLAAAAWPTGAGEAHAGDGRIDSTATATT